MVLLIHTLHWRECNLLNHNFLFGKGCSGTSSWMQEICFGFRIERIETPRVMTATLIGCFMSLGFVGIGVTCHHLSLGVRSAGTWSWFTRKENCRWCFNTYILQKSLEISVKLWSTINKIFLYKLALNSGSLRVRCKYGGWEGTPQETEEGSRQLWRVAA